MIRFYLAPVETTANGQRGPKYFPYRFDPDPPALIQLGDNGQSIRLEVRDFGNEPSMMIAANTSDADDASLAALSDVTKFADDLDQQLGADLGVMQTALEALKLPAQMLTATTTHKQVVKGIIAVFSVAECMQGKGFRVFGGAITLSTQLSALGVPARTALQDCAVNLKYNINGITLASTIRDVLTKLVQQAVPTTMLGVTIS